MHLNPYNSVQKSEFHPIFIVSMYLKECLKIGNDSQYAETVSLYIETVEFISDGYKT